MQVEPVMLEGDHVRLEPLTLGHLEVLCAVGLDPELWRWTGVTVTTRERMDAYVRTALEWQVAGSAVPFATVERASGKVVGSTRFANMSVQDRRVEIGWTWIAPPWQRTVINTEAKYLMLRHAFEVWDMNRVELKTDVLNTKSRRAIERLGAKEEGVFRHHQVTESGRLRDTVYYSILREEWGEIGKRLAGTVEG